MDRVQSLEKFIAEFGAYLKGYNCSSDGYDEIQEIIEKFDELMWEHVDKPQ
jgi:hypothetical protein